MDICFNWDDAAHLFYDGGLHINWRPLGAGVTYAYAERGLYVVRETEGQAPWRNQTFSFYKAKSVEELRKLYYGERNE